MLVSPLALKGEESKAKPVKKIEKQTEPGLSIQFTNKIASNFVGRGNDLGTYYSIREGKKLGPHSGMIQYMPDIYFSTPIKGLSVFFEYSWPMAGRSDKDIDQRLQTSPAGTNLLADNIKNGTLNSSGVLAAINTNTTDLPAALSAGERPGVVGFYKEEVGTRRLEWGFANVDYKRVTKKGTFNIGYNLVLAASVLGSAATREAYTFPELYIGYALPYFPDLSLIVHMSTKSSSLYHLLRYDKKIQLTKTMSLKTGLHTAYAVKSRKQGLHLVSSYISLHFYGFHVKLNLFYRPNLYFFDGDTGDRDLPLWLAGQSTGYDGLVEDYSKTHGAYNEAQNLIIEKFLQGGNSNYTYTPQAKLPRFLHYVVAGYTITY